MWIGGTAGDAIPLPRARRSRERAKPSEGGVRGGALSFGRISHRGLRSQGCHADGSERGRRRRVKFRGGYASETKNGGRGRKSEQRERERERRKTGMSLPLKKSCPNKGALFHAQCTPPQTRSLRYLSPRNARCSQRLLLSAPYRPSSRFLSLFPPLETLENGAPFLMVLCSSTCKTLGEPRRGLPVTDCDNSLISLDVSCPCFHTSHPAAR